MSFVTNNKIYEVLAWFRWMLLLEIIVFPCFDDSVDGNVAGEEEVDSESTGTEDEPDTGILSRCMISWPRFAPTLSLQDFCKRKKFTFHCYSF